MTTPVPATDPSITDLLGHGLDEPERAVLQIYTALSDAVQRDDLPPCVAANLRAALAPVAIAVTDLGLRFEHLTDLSV